MSPSPKVVSNNKKSGSSSKLKRMFSKFMFKEKVTKVEEDNEYTIDAVPDLPRRNINENNLEQNIEANNVLEDKNLNNETNNLKYENVGTKTEKRSENDVNEEELRKDSPESESSGIGTGHKPYSSPNIKQGAQFILNQTSVVVNNGVGLQFGDNYTSVKNVFYGQTPPKGVTKIEKTKAIRDLLRCNDKIEAGHLQVLSSHLGKSWEEVGLSLGFTKGELQCIKDEEKELQERGFLMLKKWWQKEGAAATVGSLCKTLWKTVVAREAVKQLSVNIELLK